VHWVWCSRDSPSPFQASKRAKEEEEANDQKVGSLRNETLCLEEHTFSCTFHDKHSPRKTASKQASKQASKAQLYLHALLFPFFSWDFFSFFHSTWPPRTFFSIKGYLQK
jgi:hypothetical protein